MDAGPAKRDRAEGSDVIAEDALALVSAMTRSQLTLLDDGVTSARRYASEAKAVSTRRAYRSDFAIFSTWCTARGLSPLPAAPSAVAAFFDRAYGGAKVATGERRRAAIRFAHLLAGRHNPCSDRAAAVVMQGIRRARGSARAQKAAATAERMAAKLSAIPDTLTGKRDRALLCLGFSGAFRRSDLVALEVQDLDEVADGIRVMTRK